MYIRELQGRVQYLRHDLPVGFSEQALQDAARYVARKTGIIRTTVYGYLPANQVTLDLNAFMGSVAGSFVILRPTQIMAYTGILVNSAFQSLLTPTSFTVPAPSVALPNVFYVASAAITATDGTTTYPMNAGDTIQNQTPTSGKWVVVPGWKYSVMSDISKGRMFGTIRQPLNNVGMAANFIVDDKASILLTPVPVTDTPVSITCSIVPQKEFENIDIPVDAEDAIVLCASERIMRSPNKAGGGADHPRADKFGVRAEGEISLIRAIAEAGYGEAEIAAPPRFGN
jgi:hypothetical protein